MACTPTFKQTGNCVVPLVGGTTKKAWYATIEQWRAYKRTSGATQTANVITTLPTATAFLNSVEIGAKANFEPVFGNRKDEGGQNVFALSAKFMAYTNDPAKVLELSKMAASEGIVLIVENKDSDADAYFNVYGDICGMQMAADDSMTANASLNNSNITMLLATDTETGNFEKYPFVSLKVTGTGTIYEDTLDAITALTIA